MKKLSPWFISISLLAASTSSFAQTTQLSDAATNFPLQNIVLKDGTVLKGQLVAVDADSYVIQTSQLGKVAVKAAQIQSIAPAANAPTFEPAILPQAQPSTAGTPMIPGNLNQMTQSFMGNPDINKSVQELLQDPQIMDLLKDPALMKDVFSMDAQKIQNNPAVQNLLQNPKMQEIMEKMAQQMQKQQGQPSAQDQ